MLTKFLRGVVSDYQNCKNKDSCDGCRAYRKIPSTPANYCELLREHGKIASNAIKETIDKHL